jgi:hypothetical protein
MDLVEIKYQNFKMFLKPKINDTAHEMALNAASLQLFLKSLNQYVANTPEEITEKLCTTFNVNMSDYSENDIDKFHRYIEYFQNVIKTIGV